MAAAPVVIDLDVRAPVEEVWQAWTEPKGLARWLATAADVELQPGGRFSLRIAPPGGEEFRTEGCVVLSVDEEYSLGFNWKGPASFAPLVNAEPLPTSVTVRFQPLGPARSRLHLEHAGWGDGEAWSAARTWHEKMWREALEALKRRLEPG